MLQVIRHRYIVDILVHLETTQFSRVDVLIQERIVPIKHPHCIFESARAKSSNRYL